MEHTEYLDKKGVAALLKISVRTLEGLMREGLPYLKIGRRVLFRREDLDNWLLRKLRPGK